MAFPPSMPIKLPPLEAYSNGSYQELIRLSADRITDVFHHKTSFFDTSFFESNLAILLYYYNQNYIHDIGCAVVGAIVLTIVRVVLSKIVLNFLLKHRIIAKQNSGRFMESFYSCVYYSASFYLAYQIEKKAGYLTHPERLWIDFDLSNQIPSQVRLLYLVESSHYLHCLYAIVYINQLNTQDALIMFVHHIVALLLISISFFTKTYRLGILVLYLLDICDVIMEGCKLLLKVELEHKLMIKLVEAVRVVQFLSLVVFWFLFRLYYFPLRVIYPAVLYLTYNDIESWFPLGFLLFCLLWLIFALNVYWGVLIIKILVNAIRGGTKEIEDIREVEEDEEEDLEKKQTDGKIDLNKKSN